MAEGIPPLRRAVAAPLAALGWAALLALALSLAGCRREEPAVAGTATYAGGLPLPANAVFEASLLDVSRADAPATVIGSVLTGGPGASPIAFRIPYDPTRIDTTHSYAVRARLTADRSVLYLTDQAWPVLTRGHGPQADISLVPVGITRSLPASFTGTLPCADCAGIRYQIDLLPDSVFYLRTVHQGAGDSLVRDDIGRWTLDRDGARLTLQGAGDAEAFAPFGASVLRKLDREGRSIGSGLSYDLRRTSQVPPLEPTLPLRGVYREVAEGALFADCRTGRPIPVAAGAGRAALEAAYRRIRAAPGAEVLVRLEGRIQRSDPSRASAVVVTRFLGAARTERC